MTPPHVDGVWKPRVMWLDYFINHEIRIPLKNSKGFHGKYPAVFFSVTHLVVWEVGEKMKPPCKVGPLLVINGVRKPL